MDRDTVVEQFSSLKTRKDVANILGVKEKSLRYFLYKRRPENMYHFFEIPKRDGTKRKISAPDEQLKEIQRKLNEVLSAIYEPKVCAYGFLNGKSILDNATQHVNRRIVLNVDLKDFFTQVHFGRVRGMLMKAPYSIGKKLPQQSHRLLALMVSCRRVHRLRQLSPTWFVYPWIMR